MLVLASSTGATYSAALFVSCCSRQVEVMLSSDSLMFAIGSWSVMYSCSLILPVRTVALMTTRPCVSQWSPHTLCCVGTLKEASLYVVSMNFCSFLHSQPVISSLQNRPPVVPFCLAVSVFLQTCIFNKQHFPKLLHISWSPPFNLDLLGCNIIRHYLSWCKAFHISEMSLDSDNNSLLSGDKCVMLWSETALQQAFTDSDTTLITSNSYNYAQINSYWEPLNRLLIKLVFISLFCSEWQMDKFSVLLMSTVQQFCSWTVWCQESEERPILDGNLSGDNKCWLLLLIVSIKVWVTATCVSSEYN